MPHLSQLYREYEERRFPPTRRLDLQAEGPETARERARRWIQTFAHEAPGVELLLVVQRGAVQPGRPGPVQVGVERLLRELSGQLVEWWEPFSPGTLALRVMDRPGVARPPATDPLAATDGRVPATAGAAYVPPEEDIPGELLPIARRIVELRRERDGLSIEVGDVLLREVWLETEATAMVEGSDCGVVMLRLEADERRRLLEEE